MVAKIEEVKKGDIVRFKTYSLRVESEPVVEKNGVRLNGRSSMDGCPLVSKWYICGTVVNVDKM